MPRGAPAGRGPVKASGRRALGTTARTLRRWAEDPPFAPCSPSRPTPRSTSPPSRRCESYCTAPTRRFASPPPPNWSATRQRATLASSADGVVSRFERPGATGTGRDRIVEPTAYGWTQRVETPVAAPPDRAPARPAVRQTSATANPAHAVTSITDRHQSSLYTATPPCASRRRPAEGIGWAAQR